MRTFPGCVMLLAAGLLSVGALGLTACEPEVPGEVTGTCDATRQAEIATDEYFDSVIKPTIFEPYCSRCHYSTAGDDRHGAPEGVDYDTRDAATTRIAATWFRVKTYDMPPMGRVPNLEEMATLNEWLNCELASDSGDDDDSAGDDDDSAR
ncbi:MAG: hypothetical protein KDA24_08405 [Deltaproteobacteria bacterium]|nr:hypothetical protein [Deltaproteobacteria bacterium]